MPTHCSLRTTDLVRLNRRVRYPDVPPYHARDPDTGQLLDVPNRPAGEVLATEKIDGAHARLVLLPDGYLIGDRTDWLFASGDLVANPARGIVKAVRPLADAIALPAIPGPVVAFGEVFGGKASPAGPQYTSKRALGFRVFDVARVPDDESGDASGLPFLPEDELQEFAAAHGLKLVPRVARFPAPDLPRTIDATRTFLEEVLPTSRCRLDGDAGGEPEGLVLRKADRSWVVALRAADYRRARKKKR
jgi:hypothetical protein